MNTRELPPPLTFDLDLSGVHANQRRLENAGGLSERGDGAANVDE